MKAINFRGANKIYGPPLNWDRERDGECLRLPVMEAAGVCLSAWKPSEQELAQLAAGGAIVLQVYGVQPPVALSVQTVEEFRVASERGEDK